MKALLKFQSLLKVLRMSGIFFVFAAVTVGWFVLNEAYPESANHLT